MNNLLYFLIAAAVSHEMLLAGNCPDGSSGTTIFFVNGINTDEVEAARSLAILEFEVRGKIAGTVKAGTCLKFKGSYNETANMLADLYEALKQTVAAGQAAPALSQILLGRLPLPDSLANRLAAYTPIRLDQLVTEPAQSEVDQFAREYRDELNAGNSVIVVGYSQGNLFANSARRKLQQISVPDLSGFKLIAVATPAHLVEGGGPWVTLCGDMIKLVPGSLPFNFGGFIGCEKLRVPYGWFIHKFVESYLTDTQTLSAIRDLIYAAIPGPNQRPTAGFLMTSSSASGLNGQALNLTVSPGRAQVVNLNAQAPYSFDPDGSIVSYEWTIRGIRGTYATLTGSSVSYEFTAGVYLVELIVTDNRGARATATGNITVTSESEPLPILPASPLTVSRMLHQAVELGNGEVLITGGFTVYPTTVTASAEALGFRGPRNTAGQLVVPRAQHTATLLVDGRVLIVGGQNAPQYSEIYDPATDRFRLLDVTAGNRIGHTATRLLNGHVLVCGGVASPSSRANPSCSTFDPGTERWTGRAPMPVAAIGHEATLLQDGTVLVTGGYDGFDRASTTAAVSRYFPSTDTWRVMQPMLSRRYTHTATLLPNGTVLIAGGLLGSVPYSSAEIYDAGVGETGMSSFTGSMRLPKREHTATLLGDGRVLISGGHNNDGTTYRATEIYSPSTGLFSEGPLLQVPRQQHTSTLLRTGQVVIAGGNNGSVALASTEIIP